MKTILWLILLDFTAVAQQTAIVNVNVIDVEKGKVLANQTVVIAGNTIAYIGKKTALAKRGKTFDGRGKFLIPGLWDMHTHTLRTERIETFFRLLIANGITGVRDMAMPLENLELLKKWRQEIQEGSRVGPRIFASGATLGGVRPQLTIPINSEAEARQAVLTLKQRGADFVKVHSLLPRSAFFAVAKEAKKQGLDLVGHVPVSVTAAEASDAGQKSMEHLYGILEACSRKEEEVRKEVEQGAVNPDSWAAWGAVVRITDRLYGQQARDNTFDKTKCSALFARFLKNGTWQCPTLVMRRALALREDSSFRKDVLLKYISRSDANSWNAQTDTRNRNLYEEEIINRKIRLAKESELVGEMSQAGIKILAGTDLGNPYVYPGFSLHDELQLLVQAGLTPMQALKATTLNPAKFFGRENEFGTIAKGKLADLVLLDANPLENISNTKKIHAVIANGRLLQREQLDALLQTAEMQAK